MKKYRLFSAISLVAALLSACSQDELGGQGTALPEGEYPLQIGGVSIVAEASEQPWTRVSENPTDGMGSVWQDGDKIGVRIGDNEETGIYVVNVDENGTVTSITPETPVYWTSATSATVTAWYPATDGAVYLNRQDDNGLAYVMRGTGQGSHQNPVTLTFTHQLAKVRVVTKGTAEVLNMELADFPEGCVVTEGKITEVPSFTNYLPTRQATYEGIGKCWEANVTPDAELKAFRITVPVDGSTGAFYREWGSTVTMEAGKLHTIELTVNRQGTIDLSQWTQTYTISADGDYYFNGTGNHGIRVTGGNPNIYLGDAHISVTDGNAISIESGSATIHVMGENNVTSDSGAGIYVAQNSSVTITGRSREEDELTATGREGGAGIGSYSTSDGTNNSCGNIIINNLTLTARSEGSVHAGEYAAGIGSAGIGTVGSISISDATIYAQGGGDNRNMGAAAIGGGVDGTSSNIQTAFNITISNSTIHATRGCPHASYIGAGGFSYVSAGYNIISTAQITNSHIYDGNGNEITQ